MFRRQVSQRQREDTVMEASSRRNLYKCEALALKVLPMLIVFVCLLNTTLSCFGIDLQVLSYIGGVSFLPLAFLYLSSYVFKFCEYHRMFLHYTVITNIINIYDYYVGVPVSTRGLLCIHAIITAICLFLILYLYVRCHKRPAVESD